MHDRIRERYERRQIGWPELWVTIAQLAAMRSRCSRDRVGAVLVSHDNVQLSLGYNGAPTGHTLDGGTWCVDWCKRAKAHRRGVPAGTSYDDCPANHAEVNTLLRAPKHHGPTIMYISTVPCVGCAKFIGACATTHGVTEVVASMGGVGDQYRDLDAAIGMLRNCGVIFRGWSEDHFVVE